MKDQVYYTVDSGKIEQVYVRDSELNEDCFDVKFEGRDYYSPIRKGLFLNSATTSKKEAMRLLIKELQNRKTKIQIEAAEIEKSISEICKEMLRLP